MLRANYPVDAVIGLENLAQDLLCLLTSFFDVAGHLLLQLLLGTLLKRHAVDLS